MTREPSCGRSGPGGQRTTKGIATLPELDTEGKFDTEEWRRFIEESPDRNIDSEKRFKHDESNLESIPRMLNEVYTLRPWATTSI